MDHRPQPQPLACEPLERRRLLAGIAVVGKILEVKGVNLEPNVITVGLAPGGTEVTATIVATAKNGKVNTFTKTVRLAGLKRAIIEGGKTNDLITIDQTNGPFPLTSRIITGNGNDTVLGGDESDSIRSGRGDDYLSGGPGNDKIFAVEGPSTLIGGTGKDTLHGGRGKDDIDGSAGTDDVLIGGHGGDTLLGGDAPGSINTFISTPTFVKTIQNNFRKHVDHLHIEIYSPPEEYKTFFDELFGIGNNGNFLGFL